MLTARNGSFFMENIDKILSLKNINIREFLVDIFFIILSGMAMLTLGPNLQNLLPENVWIFTLTNLKHPADGIALMIWIFFTFVFYLVIKSTFLAVHRINTKESYHYAPPIKFSDLIYQGWLEIKKDNEIYLTNSNSGLLFKKPWFKNFKASFKFKFDGLETTIVRGIYDGKLIDKMHKFNYLGLLFRAQSLEDYFMFSIGILVNIDDYNVKLKKFKNENVLLKNTKFDVVITPHIKLNGKWERLGGRSIGSSINITKFTDVDCVISENTATLEIGGKSFCWNLPTNFDGAIAPKEEIKTDELASTKSTKIPFQTQRGMVGFRSYHAEHSILEDIVITKI